MTRSRDELSVLLKRLAHAQRVYVRSGRLHPASGGANGVLAAIAAETHTLVGRLHRKDWQQHASDPDGPAPVEQVEAALEPIAAENAAVDASADARTLLGRYGDGDVSCYTNISAAETSALSSSPPKRSASSGASTPVDAH